MNWTIADLKKLYQIVKPFAETSKEAEAFRKAATDLKRTPTSCRVRYLNTSWNKVFGKARRSSSVNGLWSKSEIKALHSLKVSQGFDYDEIAERLGKTVGSCKQKFETMKWDSFLKESDDSDASESSIPPNKIQLPSNEYVDLIAVLAHYSPEELEVLKEEDFLRKLSDTVGKKVTRSSLDEPFDKMKKRAYEQLDQFGFTYPSMVEFGPGTYVIVGDSHGKHTKKGVFRLLDVIQKELCPSKIIHLGNLCDDHNDISFLWEKYDNLVIVGWRPELALLKSMTHQYNVVRDKVVLGDLTVQNQNLVTDSVETFIGNIRTRLFAPNVIVNCHRHELHNRVLYKKAGLIASPGCLCEPHVVMTLRVLVSKDGKLTVRETRTDGYHKYNRQRDLLPTWEQGMIIVEVDKDGTAHMHPTRMFMTSKGYAISYMDKIITEHGVFKPNEKTIITADAHCSYHDPEVLDLQDQFCSDYKPNNSVNVGDLLNNQSLNHHMMDSTGGAITETNVLGEVAAAKWVLQKASRWAKNNHLLFGNHERFMRDFCQRFPQLKDMLDMEFFLGLKGMGVSLTEFKKALELHGVHYIHGDMKMFGMSGRKLDQFANAFPSPCVIGNIHYPAIRQGCYSVGFSGKYDQKYNEVDVTQWLHGFGTCNTFEGFNFISLVSIRDKKFRISGKTYAPKDAASWVCPSFSASIGFSFDQAEEKGLKTGKKIPRQNK